ncbi:MAG: hypothetical protein K2M06_02255 [Muribaculaceae bacterium]|nr:hypothetical protein [Muribaculaceae bacterium]
MQSEVPDSTRPVSPENMISAERLNAECLRRRYLSLLEKAEVFPSEANWNFIIENRMEGLGHLLLRKYYVSRLMPEDKRSIYHRQAIRLFPEYLKAVPRAYAVDVAYSDIQSDPDGFTELIRQASLFDANSLRVMVEERGAVELAISVLDVFQPEYNSADAVAMRRLLGALRSLPKLGRVEERHGLFSHDIRYYCPAGHSNSSDEAFCTHADCRLNIYGLTPEQAKAIDDFQERLEALESLLRRRSQG